jgi:U3 small nucleolar RNA-associated protein 20
LYRFLTCQYYVGFKDDPEVPFLKQIGLFDIVEGTQGIPSVSVFPAKILKKRLEMFLQVFAAVTSPKQLFCHQLLYAFYLEIMAKADVNTVKLAFDCIVTYKSSAIVPYKDNIKRLLDDKLIRDELVNLDATREANKDGESEPLIKADHRAELVPLLVRVVYGRFTSKARGSKAARDQNIAR